MTAPFSEAEVNGVGCSPLRIGLNPLEASAAATRGVVNAGAGAEVAFVALFGIEFRLPRGDGMSRESSALAADALKLPALHDSATIIGSMMPKVCRSL